MTGEAWGCVFMLAVLSVVSVALYWLAFFILGVFELGELHRTALSLLLGIVGALSAAWFLAVSDLKGRK